VAEEILFVLIEVVEHFPEAHDTLPARLLCGGVVEDLKDGRDVPACRSLGVGRGKHPLREKVKLQVKLGELSLKGFGVIHLGIRTENRTVPIFSFQFPLILFFPNLVGNPFDRQLLGRKFLAHPNKFDLW